MTRWLALALLIVAISAASAWLSLTPGGRGKTLGGVAFPSKGIGETEMTGPPPTIVIDDKMAFEFGVMGQQEIGTRDFVIGNEGPGDLVLTGTEPSCSCTVGNLKPGESVVVKPGETFTVTIRWETRDFQGQYEKFALIETNDPQRPELLFTARGEVQPDLVVLPEGSSIDLRRVTNDEVRKTSFVISSPSRPETVITSLSSSRPEQFTLSQEPLTDELRGRLKLDSGYEVRVEFRPGKELGPFLEEIIVQTDHPKKPELRLSVGGTVIGPISVTPATVRMRNVNSETGDSTSALIWVRGQGETEFEVASVPEGLHVAVIPADQTAEATSETITGRAYRMTVTVAPGTPPGVIQQPIVLKTSHPGAGELSIPLEIRILGEG